MSVTGAFYPAIDLVAGEKERGTMETLLICPASRTEIVIGKFLTVMTFSMSTAILNLISMGLTGNYMMSMARGSALNQISNLTPPSLSALMWVLVLLVPLAALFSALCLSLATFARSSKEGQYYLTPLLMVTMGLTVFCLMPTVEITPFYSVMPVVGPSLLLKELLVSPGSAGPLVYAIPVLVTSVIYSLLALWWAIEQFSREEVLFREAERFEVALWLRHLLRDKEATPSFAEGGVCFVLIMLIQFASLKFFNKAVMQAPSGVAMLRLQMIFLVTTIACPALIMSIMLTTNVFQTLRLRWPRWGMLGVAVVLPVTLHPLSAELLARLDWFFPPLPEGAARLFESLSSSSIPLWLTLLAFAITPAVCEELAFRGFILSGFSRSKRKWLAIVLSALAFGIVHMIPQQVFNAALLGLVLGLIVIQSRSLFPAMLFHFTFNALPILRGKLGEKIGTDWVKVAPAEWFFFDDGGLVRYQWPTLLIAAAVSIVMLRWLVNQPPDESSATVERPAVETDRLHESGLPKNTSLRV
jgi:sodium transport system permease protein